MFDVDEWSQKSFLKESKALGIQYFDLFSLPDETDGDSLFLSLYLCVVDKEPTEDIIIHTNAQLNSRERVNMAQGFPYITLSNFLPEPTTDDFFFYLKPSSCISNSFPSLKSPSLLNLGVEENQIQHM